MRFIKSLLLASIAAVLCLSAQTSGFTACSQINCSPNLCCQDTVSGPACYSTSQYMCISSGTTTRLCPPGSGVCGGSCFELNRYQCVNGGLQQGATQPTTGSPTQAATTSKPATAAPTSPAAATTAAPTAATTTAPTNAPASCASICGTMSCCQDSVTGSTACYNPSQYSCPVYNGGLSQRLCPLGNGACAGNCYNKTMYTCHSNGTLSLGGTSANKPGIPGLPGIPTTTTTTAPTTPAATTTTAPTTPITTSPATNPATNPATTPAATAPATTPAATAPATTPAATAPATTPAATTPAATTPATTPAATTPATTPAATTPATTPAATTVPVTAAPTNAPTNPSGLFTPLQPFCVGACQSPVAQGIPSGTNAIPRSSPDGVGKWAVEESCNAGWSYGVPPRATWWDNYASTQALPTNMWFIPYFSNPPNSVNAQGLTWPVYAMPFSTQATGTGFMIGVPTPSLIQSQPGLFDGSPPPVLGFGVTTQQWTFRTSDGFAQGQKIIDFDRDGTGITLQYYTNGGQTMTIPVIRGHPFTTLIFTSTIPVIDYTVGAIGVVNGVNTANQATTVVQAVAAAGMYVYDITIVAGTTPNYGFRLYSSQNIPITVSQPHTVGCVLSPWTITFNSPCVGTCILRMAAYTSSYADPVNPAVFYSSTLSIPVSVLDASANVYPVVNSANPNRTVQFYDGNNVLNQYMYWNTACVVPGAASCNPANLLMLALPHHLDLLPASQIMSTVTFPTQNGIAHGILGNSWTLSFNVPNIVGQTLLNDPFQFQVPITNPAITAQISGTLGTDMATLIGPINYATFDGADAYSFGKYIAAVARLTLIADSLGNATIAAQGRTFMRERLDSWFNVNSAVFPFRTQDELTYDLTWGGIIPSDAMGYPGGLWSSDSTQPEFGSGGYNDHMFHYGYFLYAVAAVIKSGSAVDVAWFQSDFNHIIALARDIANPDPVNDPWFTGFRHKNDWYVGHSWACGLFPSGDYPNVESTSEALNAWYAIYLLGTAMEEIGTYGSFATNMKFVGKMLSVTDTQSFHYYSRMYPEPSGNNALVYPTEFTALGVIGNLWGGQAIFQTYFGFGDCEDMSAPLLPSYPPSCVQRHILTGDQVRYYNSLMVFLIQAMPFTPYTNTLQNVTWLSQGLFAPAAVFTNPDGSVSVGYSPDGKSQFIPDFFNRCADNDGCDSWLAYGWQSAAAVNGANRTAALAELSLYGSVPAGTTMTNILFHIASQAS